MITAGDETKRLRQSQRGNSIMDTQPDSFPTRNAHLSRSYDLRKSAHNKNNTVISGLDQRPMLPEIHNPKRKKQKDIIDKIPTTF